MIIHSNIDSVWINTKEGVTVYFNHNHLGGYMSGYVNTPCGPFIVIPFGKCDSIEDGREQLKKLNQKDADRIFAEILDLEEWKDYGIENFQTVSETQPIGQ